MVSDVFTYVATSVIILGVVFGIATYIRDHNSKLIMKIEKDIDITEWSNDMQIGYLRTVNCVAQAENFAADMTRAKEEFCEDIRLASHDDKQRLACRKTYFQQLVSISTKIKAAGRVAFRNSNVSRPPPISQRSLVAQRGRIQDTRRTDGYGILADGKGARVPASVASTHTSAAVENVRRPFPQTAAVEEGGTSPAVEATPRAPAAAEREAADSAVAEPEDADSAVAEREDADSAVAEQEDVGSVTTGGSIRLKTLRSTRSQDGDSAYFSIRSSNTPTG